MDSTFFVRNRGAIARELNGMLVVASAYDLTQRSNDSAHSFTQESNFWYLSGIDDPGWMLIHDGSKGYSWLIAPNVSETHRIFEGGMSFDEAKRLSGVDKVITADEGTVLLRQLAKRHTVAGTVGPPSHHEYFNFSLNTATARTKQLLERTFSNVQDIRTDLAKLRAIKQAEEIVSIQRAVNITTKAFKHVRNNINDFSSESDIEAEFSYLQRKSGARGHAYDPIIAAGKNACTLHYGKNSEKISKRQMVLMDVGAEYGHYAADITRTYAKGEVTKRQREVHTAVESAHHRIIGLLAPMSSVESYQRQVDDIMADAIGSIGLDASKEGVRKYFPHAISHGLGIDVHDSLGAPKYFQENMVLTVEPGIYIPEEGIGIRIEDDILITATGRKNLSADLSTGL